MKRLLFLLLIVSSAISVSAQRDSRRNDDRNERYHYKYDRKKDIRHSRGDRDAYRRQIASINHQFDSRIHSIRKNPFMGRNQKNRKIRELEMHRRVALSELRDRFSSGRARDYARDRRGNNRKW